LPDLDVTGILQDNDGNLWISSTTGLAKMEKNIVSQSDASIDSISNSSADVFRRYYASDGLPLKFLRGLIVQRQSRQLWFGTVAGLVSFKPAISKNKMPLLF